MKKRWLEIGLAVIAAGLTGFVLLLPTPRATASFNANNLLDDYVMENANSMSAAQIDAFFNAFPNSCLSQNNGFSTPDPTGYAPSTGYTYGNNVTAGAALAHVADGYGINPQVLIATLEKESSVVTGNASYHCQYINTAMGYDCPDSGNCPQNPATESGFSKQVVHAAWLLRFGEERSEGNTGWAEIHGNWNNSDDPGTCYGGPMTQGYRKRCSSDANAVYYDGYTTIDGSSVHLDTGATAALYWYTPHFHGNQLFVSIFESWFGPTTGGGFQKVISDNPNDLRQWVVYGSIKQQIPDSQTVYAWGLQNVTLTTMPAAQLANISTGPNLDRLMRLNTNTGALYFVDGGKRYIFRRPGLFEAWNIGSHVTSYVSPGLFGNLSDGGDMQFAVQNPGTSNIYMVDGANGGGQTILRGYSSMAMLAAWEGDNPSYIALDSQSGFFDQIDNAIGSTLTTTKASCNGTDFQAIGGYRLTQPGNLASLFPGSAQGVSTATFNRLIAGAAGNISPLLQAIGSPTVYLMDGGTKHQILWPSALTSWAPAGQPITSVTSGYLNAISAGATLGGYLANVSGQLYVVDSGTKTAVPSALNTAYGNISGAYNASAALMAFYPQQPTAATGYIQGIGSPTVYLLDNSSKLRQFEWPDKLALYGGGLNNITYFSNYIVDSITKTTSPSLFVSDGSTNYVIENGQKWTVSAGVQSTWGLTSPQTFSDGTLDRFSTGGAMDTKFRSGNAYILVRDHAGFATADPNIANVWAIDTAPVHDARLATSLLTLYPLTRFVASSTDSRTFVIDNGNWYNVGAGPRNNLGGPNEPTMTLNPTNAPNTITDWTAFIVKDGNGTNYVIDGAGKRTFPNSVIQNWWTGSGSVTVPTVTNGFLNLLPTRGFVERAVKGSAPMVYSAENGTKRHILYPDTYNCCYAPYGTVTDQLLNTMPNGPPI